MPLTRAEPRDHIHTREIRCRGFRRADGLWDVEGLLEDTKTYSFDNRDRAGIVAGEPIHRMHVRITIDDNLVIRAAEAATEAGPYTICGDVTPVFGNLVGLRIGPGFRRDVYDRMGRTQGCTHLTDLLLGPMTTTAFQTVAPARARRDQEAKDGRPPPTLNTCHALAADGPIVKRQWPQFYTGDEKAGQRR